MEVEIRRIAVQGQPISKNNQTGGVAQAVEHLLCKCKGLNSKPNLPLKKV
jgi:hypothetical protein